MKKKLVILVVTVGVLALIVFIATKQKDSSRARGIMDRKSSVVRSLRNIPKPVFPENINIPKPALPVFDAKKIELPKVQTLAPKAIKELPELKKQTENLNKK